jgi:phosphomevalonate kinase
MGRDIERARRAAAGRGLMRDIAVHAPGKLFVIGEYAVLHGERALVVALDAGIVARVEPSRRWRLVAADLGLEAPLEDVAPGSGAALLAAAVAAGRAELRIAEPLSVLVCAATAAARRKHGLGGSAASVVAILGALAAIRGVDVEDEAARSMLFSLALSVHRAHQLGRGSGADVAASVYGGWIDYATADARSRLSRAEIADDFRLAAVWSGVASDTARAIAAFEPSAHLGALSAILGRFWRAVDATDRHAILCEIDAYGRELEGFAIGGGAERIARLCATARSLGWAAKGSGAVGGDCAIAVGFGDCDAAALGRGWRAAGAHPLEVSVDVRGMRRVGGGFREELHA